jgi:hypothetical protein
MRGFAATARLYCLHQAISSTLLCKADEDVSASKVAVLRQYDMIAQAALLDYLASLSRRPHADPRG